MLLCIYEIVTGSVVILYKCEDPEHVGLHQNRNYSGVLPKQQIACTERYSVSGDYYFILFFSLF